VTGRDLKTGDPCPCCGMPIKQTDPEQLRLLTLLMEALGFLPKPPAGEREGTRT